jgi:hypothetical protein
MYNMDFSSKEPICPSQERRRARLIVAGCPEADRKLKIVGQKFGIPALKREPPLAYGRNRSTI